LFIESIRIRIRELSLQHIKIVLNDVLKMQEDHPGTVISIKTHHTLNLLYNTAKRSITQIRSRGVLDVDDCDLLEQSLKNMHIHLDIPSTMPPASSMTAIHQLAWLFSNEQLTIQEKNDIEKIFLQALPNENTKRFTNESLLHPQSFSWPDFLWHKNDKIHGVYLLVNGIVEEWKLDPYDIDAYHSELRWKENNRTRQATLTTQQILSPKNLKHVHYSSVHDHPLLEKKMNLKHCLPLLKSRDEKNKQNQNCNSSSTSHKNIGNNRILCRYFNQFQLSFLR
jgi:hypothetical protein